MPGWGGAMACGGRAQAAVTTKANRGVQRTSPPDKGTGEPANYRPGRRGASPPASVHGDRRLAGLALARSTQEHTPCGPRLDERLLAEPIRADDRAVARGPGD